MLEAGIGRNVGITMANSSPTPKPAQPNSTMNKSDKANRLLSLTGVEPGTNEIRPRQDS